MIKDTHIKIPDAVGEILLRLEGAGYEAYAAGGCVRDSLLGVPPNDWDITTSAKPEDVISCFGDEQIIPTGLKHGTVTLIYRELPYEITTFRIDGEYSDNRRPDSVVFTLSLREDLSRRDFTVNALACDRNGQVYDYFNGLADLDNKVIRCVGDAETRFSEDALRIFRCARFACTLGFTIEKDTARAMCKLCTNMDYVARERVRAELCKAITGDCFEEIFLKYPEPLTTSIPELTPSIGFDQHTPYHHLTIWEHTLRAVSLCEKDLTARIAALLHDIGKVECFKTDENGTGHFHGHGAAGAKIAGNILNRLRFPTEMIDTIVTLIEHHGATINPEEKSVRRWLNRLGEERLRLLMALKLADTLAHAPDYQEERLQNHSDVMSLLDKVIAANQCFSMSDLAINGRDLIALGIPEGKELGIMLNELLDLVIDSPLQNNRDTLLKYVSEKIDNR